MVAESSVIAHPMLIDIFVESWLNSIESIFFIVNGDVAADAAPRTDAIDLFHKPWPGLKQEIFANQCANGANIHNIASEFIIEQPERILIMIAWNIDFVVRPSMNQSKFSGACNLIAETDATGTDNTSSGIEQHIRTEVFFRGDVLNFKVSTLAAAMIIAKILEVTLTCLITDGAVKWVVNEQKLKDVLSCFLYTRRIGPDNKIVLPIQFSIWRGGTDCGCASGCKLTVRNNLARGRKEDMGLHKTHAAVCRTGQPRMVTVMRHFDAVLSGSLNDIGSVFNFNLEVVQFNECHDVLIMQRVGRGRTLSNRF